MSCNCNQQTNYNICNPVPCQEPQDCSCPTILSTDCVTYGGDDLTCSGIKKGTILTELIQQLDAFICKVREDLINAFTLKNIGLGARIYKGVDLLGRKEIRTITKTGDLIVVTENPNDVNLTIDEDALGDFINTLVLPPPVIDTSFLRTSDSTPLNASLKVISDNANNASVLKLSTEDLTNNGLNNDITSTAFGQKALLTTTTAINNTGFGASTLTNTTSGSDNVGVGTFSLRYNTVGFQNTGVGAKALENNTIGDNNTAVGQQTLQKNTGNENVAVGQSAMSANTTGNENTVLGTKALTQHNTSSRNIAVGYRAMELDTTGDNNTIIGTEASSGGFNGSIVLGERAVATIDNQFVVGSTVQNAGIVQDEIITASAKVWRIVVNGIRLKVLAIEDTDIVELGDFGYSETDLAVSCTNACNLVDLVQVYRDREFGAFASATVLTTDVAMTINAPAGYYSEYSNSSSAVISRYWDGNVFTGELTVCGC